MKSRGSRAGRRIAAGPLTEKQRRFAEEYVIDLNGTQAAVRAGYSERTAGRQAARLLADERIALAIQEGMKARSERTGIKADAVLKELWGIATADVNELVEYRRRCCRYCYGIGHHYQRTAAELAQAKIDHQIRAQEMKAVGIKLPPLDETGGIGFNPELPAVPTCPECWGEGVGRPIFKDTQAASPGARALYGGTKITRDGIEVKIHSKDRALELLGKHLRLFTDCVEHTGRDGGPIRLADPMNPEAAEKLDAFLDELRSGLVPPSGLAGSEQ